MLNHIQRNKIETSMALPYEARQFTNALSNTLSNDSLQSSRHAIAPSREACRPSLDNFVPKFPQDHPDIDWREFGVLINMNQIPELHNILAAVVRGARPP